MSDLVGAVLFGTPVLALCLAMIYDWLAEGRANRQARLAQHQRQLQALREENDRLRAQLAQANVETRP